MSEAFGFKVKKHSVLDDSSDDPDARVVVPGMWEVHLPHQCSAWDIAGESGWEGEPHADAVAALEKFIAEAQEALAALREEREFGTEDGAANG